ncbi:hypothetical protein R6Q57_021425 [Mikania cordata]
MMKLALGARNVTSIQNRRLKTSLWSLKTPPERASKDAALRALRRRQADRAEPHVRIKPMSKLGVYRRLHAPITTRVDICILRICFSDELLKMALMGGFARIAQQTVEIAEAAVRKAKGKRQTIEANLALRRARTRVEAINAIS